METRESSVLVRVAGLVACAMVALPMAPGFTERPEQILNPRNALGLGGIALFGALFWLITSERPLSRRTQLVLVALQSVLALAIGPLLDNSLTGILLVLTATQLAELLPLRQALAWLAVQTLGFSAFLAFVGTDTWVNFAVSLAFGGFQVFGLHSSITTLRERRGREDLARVNAELLATRKLLEDSSRAAERVRISHELHDVMGHHLTALSLSLEAARHAPASDTARHVETAQGLTKKMLQEVRDVVGQLREAAPIDLAGALEQLAAGTERPRVHLAFPGGLRIDDPERAHALLRCAQEVLTNAVRHSGARNLWLELAQGPDGLELRARDDGRGAGGVRPGNGLTGMRERLEGLGGRLAVDSTPGDGFRVTAWLPLSPAGALP